MITNLKNKKTLLLVLAFLLLIVGAYLLHNPKYVQAPAEPATSNPSATNTPSNEPGWLTFSDPNLGISFQYPESLGTSYISTVDWPPKVAVIATPFNCVSAGSEVAPAGKTGIQPINGTPYCVTVESEGAAGSIYDQYAYAFDRGSKEIILTFTLREVQCDNYPEPKATECKTERASFDPGIVADKIAATLKLK